MKQAVSHLLRRGVSTALAATLLLVTSLPAHASVQLRGFRGLMWGDPSAHLGAAERISSDGAVQCYRRTNENLLFGDSPLQGVRYCFHRDQLFMVLVDAAVDAATLQAEFQRGYGAPDTASASFARWGGPQAPLQVELNPTRSQSAGGATLRIVASAYAPRVQ